MIEFISQLPTEYQEVEYIQSSGTQYIDTGVVATSGFEIDIKINIDTVTGSWAPILSAHELSAPYKRNFIAYTSSKEMEIDAGDKITQTSVTLTGDDVIKASNVENNFYLNINGTNYTPTVTTAASNLAYSGRTMHLLHSNGYDFGYTSGKVYYCKITVDGTLVRSFVPCYRKSDNIVGLYDLVNGVFYTNAGTGNFAKGKNSNSHSDVVITPGGVILMQYALKRRMMMSALGSGVAVAALSITYTGAHTDYGMVTMSDGARYRLLAFTASGTLSIEQPVNCEVCVVGGGANGTNAANSGPSAGPGGGGAGAYLKNQSVSAYNGGSVVVGAAQGISSIGGVSVAAVAGTNGGTGAGGKTAGTGDGLSKYPFEDTGYSLWAGKPHCGGGGQGVYEYEAGYGRLVGYNGGNGGTNGSNGYPRGSNRVSNPSSGVGGSYGGSAGGSSGNGGNATYYGSGAGGGIYYEDVDGAVWRYNGGFGYQGIVYMRIPEEQAA